MEDVVHEIVYVMSKSKKDNPDDKKMLLDVINKASKFVDESKRLTHIEKIDENLRDILFEMEEMEVEMMVELSMLSSRYRDYNIEDNSDNKNYINAISKIMLLSKLIKENHTGYARYIYPEEYYDVLKTLQKIIGTDHFEEDDLNILKEISQNYKEKELYKSYLETKIVDPDLLAAHLIFSLPGKSFTYTMK